MTLDKIAVLSLSVIGMLFTYWFFLMKKEHAVRVLNNEIEIVVKGGYSPDVITVPQNKTTKLVFIRRDVSSCLEEIVLPDFKIRKFLPLNEKVNIEITPKSKGEFRFECGMNMFHGKLIVE